MSTCVKVYSRLISGHIRLSKHLPLKSTINTTINLLCLKLGTYPCPPYISLSTREKNRVIIYRPVTSINGFSSGHTCVLVLFSDGHVASPNMLYVYRTLHIRRLDLAVYPRRNVTPHGYIAFYVSALD